MTDEMRQVYDWHLELVTLMESFCDPSLVSMLLVMEPEDFSLPAHRDLFEMVRDMHAAGQFSGIESLASPIVTLRNKYGEPAVSDLWDYLTLSRFKAPIQPAQFEAMLRGLRALRRQRESAQRAKEGAASIETSSSSIVGVEIETLSSDLATLASDLGQVAAMARGEDVARDILAKVLSPEARNKRRVYCGIDAIDHLTGGLDMGRFIVLGARPSVGKTAFGKTILLNALRDGLSCYVALAEGDRDTLMRGLFAQASGVTLTRIMRGDLNETERRKVEQAAEEIAKYRLEICDSPRLTPKQIGNRTRQLRASSGVDFVLVDYLQRLTLEEKDTREQTVAACARYFADLAKEIDACVLVLAQLNRGLDAREDKMPRLTDLRESGSLEQETDGVMFLHRPAALDPKANPRQAFFRLAKARFGVIGDVEIEFDPGPTRFIPKTGPDAPQTGGESAW